MPIAMCWICEKCKSVTPIDLTEVPKDVLLAEVERRKGDVTDKEAADVVILSWIRTNIQSGSTFTYSDIPSDIVASRFWGSNAYQKMSLWLVHKAKQKKSGFVNGGKSNGKTYFVRTT